jgi:multiple sugar transport system ATP-binding protein
MRVLLKNLSKEFLSLRGVIQALNRIDLEIKDKEYFVLLGPSGSGKSTLLNLIAGLEKPTTGEIWFDEKLVASSDKRIFYTPRERNVAFVFQSYALYPHLNVFENIAFPLRVQKTKEDKIKEAVENAAATLEISELLKDKPGELSGGQRQRVAIARAIVRQPALFLLDEPLSNLDPQLRLSTRKELKDLQRGLGITTIYVTHDQLEAISLGDRVAVLKNGKLVQVGTPEELYEKPVDTFVASFIGSPGINLIETSFYEEKGIFWVLIGKERLKMPEMKQDEFRKLSSKKCILGIRPEHISIIPAETEKILKGKINNIETLGRDVLLYISVDEVRLSVLTNRKNLEVGDMVEVKFSLEKANIFES